MDAVARGDPAQMTEEVERDPLARSAARAPGRARLRSGRLGATRLPSVVSTENLDGGLDEAESECRDIQTGYGPGLPRDQRRHGLCIGRNDRVGGQVAGTPEILRKRRAHARFQHHEEGAGEFSWF